jgi:hypothetical protein
MLHIESGSVPAPAATMGFIGRIILILYNYYSYILRTSRKARLVSWRPVSCEDGSTDPSGLFLAFFERTALESRPHMFWFDSLSPNIA